MKKKIKSNETHQGLRTNETGVRISIVSKNHHPPHQRWSKHNGLRNFFVIIIIIIILYSNQKIHVRSVFFFFFKPWKVALCICLKTVDSVNRWDLIHGRLWLSKFIFAVVFFFYSFFLSKKWSFGCFCFLLYSFCSGLTWPCNVTIHRISFSFVVDLLQLHFSPIFHFFFLVVNASRCYLEVSFTGLYKQMWIV